MKLTNVKKISRTAHEGFLDLEAVVDFGNGSEETIPFTYHSDDTEGLAPQVKTWLENNPDFPIGDYVAPEVPKRRTGEFRDFMKMFTEEERLAIVKATQNDHLIKLWYDTALGGATMSIDHPDTAKGLTAAVNAGLIAQTRADEILKNGDFNKV